MSWAEEEEKKINKSKKVSIVLAELGGFNS